MLKTMQIILKKISIYFYLIFLHLVARESSASLRRKKIYYEISKKTYLKLPLYIRSKYVSGEKSKDYKKPLYLFSRVFIM